MNNLVRFGLNNLLVCLSGQLLNLPLSPFFLTLFLLIWMNWHNNAELIEKLKANCLTYLSVHWKIIEYHRADECDLGGLWIHDFLLGVDPKPCQLAQDIDHLKQIIEENLERMHHLRELLGLNRDWNKKLKKEHRYWTCGVWQTDVRVAIICMSSHRFWCWSHGSLLWHH